MITSNRGFPIMGQLTILFPTLAHFLGARATPIWLCTLSLAARCGTSVCSSSHQSTQPHDYTWDKRILCCKHPVLQATMFNDRNTLLDHHAWKHLLDYFCDRFETTVLATSIFDFEREDNDGKTVCISHPHGALSPCVLYNTTTRWAHAVNDVDKKF